MYAVVKRCSLSYYLAVTSSKAVEICDRAMWPFRPNGPHERSPNTDASQCSPVSHFALNELDNSTAHVWVGSLDLPDEELVAMRATLSADEVARAERLAGERLRHRFIAGRGITRQLLALYCSVSPASLSFKYGAAGKPELLPPYANFHFSVSHSDSMYALSVSLVRTGVDIEKVRTFSGMQDLINEYFVNDAPAREESIEQFFFRKWTHYESLIKALGGRVGDSIASALCDYSVHTVRPIDGFILSVALQPTIKRVIVYRVAS